MILPQKAAPPSPPPPPPPPPPPSAPLEQQQHIDLPHVSEEQPWWKQQSMLPLQPCSSMMISGATGSGKTTWVYRLLQQLPQMYADDPPIETLYCYGIHQPLFNEMRSKLSNFTLHQGLPSKVELDEFTKDLRHRLIILDDLMQQVIKDNDMELLFTQGCHHRSISVIFLAQNLIPQGKNSRNIVLNTWYIVQMKNLRDSSQIAYLGRQIFPGKPKYLLEAYNDSCLKVRYGYLMVDLLPKGDDRYRVRTRVFPGEFPIIYLPKP